MKIKNLKIFKGVKSKLCALSLASTMLATGCGLSTSTDYQFDSSDTKVFGVGEHIISVEIDNPTKENMQYDYHEGYKVVGISTTSYGQYGNYFGHACLLFQNEYPVKCIPTRKNENGELVYGDFGSPINFVQSELKESTSSKEFEVGEHIISIPFEDFESGDQYESYDGYEVVGIAMSSYGKYSEYDGGGCILYVNTEPVTCVKEKDENGNVSYPSIGIVVEKDKVKTKE